MGLHCFPRCLCPSSVSASRLCFITRFISSLPPCRKQQDQIYHQPPHFMHPVITFGFLKMYIYVNSILRTDSHNFQTMTQWSESTNNKISLPTTTYWIKNTILLFIKLTSIFILIFPSIQWWISHHLWCMYFSTELLFFLIFKKHILGSVFKAEFVMLNVTLDKC